MSKRNAEAKSFKSFPDLVDKFPISLAVGSLTDKVQDISLQGFLLKGSFPEPPFRMLTSIGKLTMHTSFGKSEVDSKGIAVPLSMRVSIRELDSVSMNGKADFRRKRVEVQGGQASNTNFRGIKTILNVPNLRGNSDVTEGAKEARRKPIARASK